MEKEEEKEVKRRRLTTREKVILAIAGVAIGLLIKDRIRLKSKLDIKTGELRNADTQIRGLVREVKKDQYDKAKLADRAYGRERITK